MSRSLQQGFLLGPFFYLDVPSFAINPDISI
jgi:hypothetical protein